MAGITNLTVYRAARSARARVAAAREDARRCHPSLRWVAGDTYWVAHARGTNGAECGAEGDLILAPPGVPLCTDCYPQRPTG